MRGMEGLHWIAEHWLDLLQSVGIVGGLWFTAYTIRKDERARKVTNMLTVAQHHREIWQQLYERPDLTRLLQSADHFLAPGTRQRIGEESAVAYYNAHRH